MTRPIQPDIPWRRVTFTPARKQAGLNGGGKVGAEVFLHDAWHAIVFEMDREGFIKLSRMPERSRMLLLDSLSTMPIRANHLSLAGKKRPRGRNDKTSLIAWFTARTLGPPLLQWAKQATKDGKDPSLRQVVKAMKKDGITNTSPEAVMAYLLDRNWQNVCRINPARYSKWTSSPTSKLKTFLKQIIPEGSEPQGMLPESSETVILNILSGTKPHQVYILSNKEIESAPLMTDFRFY